MESARFQARIITYRIDYIRSLDLLGVCTKVDSVYFQRGGN